MFAFTVILTLAVMLVNGWTDAPNAIATAISTRSISPKCAVLLASASNFLGVAVMTAINSKVAATISGLVALGSGDNGNDTSGTPVLCAALSAIIVWSVAAWLFGIPTSESHALIAGLSGASVALNNGFGGICTAEWIKVLYGLVLSTLMGFCLGWLTLKAVVSFIKLVLFPRGLFQRSLYDRFFSKAQILASASTAFMHGAQDGQKFIGVLILGTYLSRGLQFSNEELSIPLWMTVLSSAVMAVGTSAGGGRIIKSVGMDMVRLKNYQGFSSDVAASFCMLISSLFGIPVSTTHTKTASIMGVGAAKRLSSVKWRVAKEMILTWVLTFPGCGIIGYVTAKLFIVIFK